MSKYYMVDVNSITSKVSRSDFKVNELEKLAQSILAAGGLLSPLLLKQTGVDSYDVLAGDREYYAAVRAKEIDPRSAETVNAFVVPEDCEDAAIDQFKTLHQSSASKVIPTATSQATQPTATSSSIDQRLINLESRLDESVREIKQTHQRDIQDLEQQIKALQQQIPQKLEALEIFNTADRAELLQKLAKARITGEKTTEKIIRGIEKARKQSTFKSFTDVVSKIDGLGDKRMLVILDAWGGLY
ncbi:MAG: ParB N-terminal domain-containing protein [Leptolyngbya sp. SIO1D8]|nr:ParB N-terminal domain-containing protein [Leptolyngbya sp. SIO1D8]